MTGLLLCPVGGRCRKRTRRGPGVEDPASSSLEAQCRVSDFGHRGDGGICAVLGGCGHDDRGGPWPRSRPAPQAGWGVRALSELANEQGLHSISSSLVLRTSRLLGLLPTTAPPSLPTRPSPGSYS